MRLTQSIRSPEYSRYGAKQFESWHMTRIEYLKQQVARAERLAKAILDRQTAERLQAFAAECRTELSELTLKTAA